MKDASELRRRLSSGEVLPALSPLPTDCRRVWLSNELRRSFCFGEAFAAMSDHCLRSSGQD
eukprot:5895635-Prymnesium_polylepis.1